MKLNVRGTRDGSLCYSCRNSIVMRGDKLGEEKVACHYYGESRIVPFHRIVECNQWESKVQTSVHEMAKIAWIVNPDRKQGKAGFLSPIERKAKGLKVGDLTDHAGTTYHMPLKEDED